jgi:acyl carrier protein
VKNEAVIHDPLHATLMRVIVETLGLDECTARELTPHGPLAGGNLGLNDLDLLEVAARIEEEFDVSFSVGSGSRDSLTSIASLASFIRRQAPVSIASQLPALDPEFDETEVMQPHRMRA